MHWGLGGLSLFPFVQFGSIAVMIGVAGMAGVFLLGRVLSPRGAITYVNVWLLSLAVVLSVNVVWAVTTEQWARFGTMIGWSVMVEMGVLATMFVSTVWFMAVSYATSLKK
jgi:hypothetical protein